MSREMLSNGNQIYIYIFKAGSLRNVCRYNRTPEDVCKLKTETQSIDKNTPNIKSLLKELLQKGRRIKQVIKDL